MKILLALLLLVGLAALVLFGLAQLWSHTPHGRLKPIFALLFKVAPHLAPGDPERAIGAAQMDTPAQIAKARADFAKGTAGLSKPVGFDGEIDDRMIEGAPGGSLAVRIYRPRQRGDATALVVYFHGGGFVVGSPDYTDAVTRLLALRTPAVVVSVDYRMAPEHPFPAAPDDCEFAVQWCHENAEALGARAGPLVVAGDSAGGNLAAVVSQRDRESGAGRIGYQVLIYPTTDLSRRDRPSQIAFASGYGLSSKDLDDCVRYYVPGGVELTHPEVSPLFSKSLEGLPPAVVITAGFDILRDEGIAYADALQRAGVPTEHRNEPGLPHGFITMTRLCGEAEATIDVIASNIRSHL